MANNTEKGIVFILVDFIVACDRFSCSQFCWSLELIDMHICIHTQYIACTLQSVIFQMLDFKQMTIANNYLA